MAWSRSVSMKPCPAPWPSQLKTRPLCLVLVPEVVAQRRLGARSRGQHPEGQRLTERGVLLRRHLGLEEQGVADRERPGERRQVLLQVAVAGRELVAEVLVDVDLVHRRVDAGELELMAAGRLEVELQDRRRGLESDVERGAVADHVRLVAVHLAVGSEEPRLVAHDRTAERRLEAVDDVVVARDVELVVRRLPLLVLRDVEEVAVELVGAGLDDRAGHAADHAPVLGREADGVHLDLRERRDGKEDARRAALLGEAGVDAVDVPGVLRRLPAVDRDHDAALETRGGALDHAGQHLERRTARCG